MIDQFPWARPFTNIDIIEKVNLLNKTIKNIVGNYIPHETITYDDWDPPWINKDIKDLIYEENQAYKLYQQYRNHIFSVHQFELHQSKLNSLFEKSVSNCCIRLSKKLSDPRTSPKSNCSVLKTFLNNKKIPCIPLLLHDNKFITNFKEKVEIFNNFFAKQCSLNKTKSDLSSVLSKKTHKLLSTIHFTSVNMLNNI